MAYDFNNLNPWDNAWGHKASEGYGSGYARPTHQGNDELSAIGASWGIGGDSGTGGPYPKPPSRPAGPQMQDPSQFGINPKPWESAWGKKPSTGYGSNAPGPLHPSDPSRPWENRWKGDSPYTQRPYGTPPPPGVEPKRWNWQRDQHEGYIRGRGWGRTDLSPQERRQVMRAMRQGRPPTDAERQETMHRQNLYNQWMTQTPEWEALARYGGNRLHGILRNEYLTEGQREAQRLAHQNLMREKRQQLFRDNPYGEWHNNQEWARPAAPPLRRGW